MENKVGDTVPSEQEVAALVKKIETVTADLRKVCVNLSKDARQSATRMRSGGENIAALVGKLATDHQLMLPGISVEGMKDDLLLAQRLAPVVTVAEELSQLLADTTLEARSEAWWAATAYYTVLSRMTDANPALEASLQPAVDFFALGRRKARTSPTK